MANGSDPISNRIAAGAASERKLRSNTAAVRFLSTFLLGWAFFLLPISVGGRWTVPFDVFISALRRHLPGLVEWYTLTLVLIGASGSVLAQVSLRKGGWTEGFATTRSLATLRLIGAFLAVVYIFEASPQPWVQAGIPRLIWQTLAVSVALIIPLGAMVVQLFVSYGGMDFLGTLAEPIMRPLFRLPGRAALDALTSWVGSYSVGLYITRAVYRQRKYTRRHVFILATCFSTVSMGFVGVVADTLHLLHLFPLLLVVYLLSVVLCAVILVRVPPTCNIPNTTLDGTPEPSATMDSREKILSRAWQAALQQASSAPALRTTLARAFGDGLVLAASILGTIVSVGTAALALARFTPLFELLGRPLVPALHVLGIPDASVVAPAVLVEITEMYIPALLVVEATEPARFFVAALSISQLIFFSSLGPMIIDMFRDIPIRGTQLVLLFLERTLILLPFLAGVLALLNRLRIFQ